jgi:NTP pyrophosphatase (non-canonical NTP hydrolase)
MPHLEEFRREILELYDGKRWDTSLRSLAFRAFVELGEFIQACMKAEAGEPNPETGRPFSEAEIAEEFSDVMHFLLEITNHFAPTVDLDAALSSKIARNWNEKKKTTDESGKVVLR